MRYVLVTGAASPLGEAVSKTFKALGVRVDGTIRPNGNKPQAGVFNEIISLDLTKRAAYLSLNKNYDAVVHIASQAEGRTSEILESTALSAALLIERMLQLEIPTLVHVSSMAVYGSINSIQVSAETPIQHTTAFGAAKWAAECFVAEAGPRIRGVSVRTPAIVGTRSHRHFLADTLAAMIEGVPVIKLFNPSFMSNNLIHEDSLANFLVHLTSSPPESYRAVPVSSGSPMMLRSIVEKLIEITRYQGRVEWSTSSVPPFSILSDQAIELGFKPLAMAETLDRWIKNITNSTADK